MKSRRRLSSEVSDFADWVRCSSRWAASLPIPVARRSCTPNLVYVSEATCGDSPRFSRRRSMPERESSSTSASSTARSNSRNAVRRSAEAAERPETWRTRSAVTTFPLASSKVRAIPATVVEGRR